LCLAGTYFKVDINMFQELKKTMTIKLNNSVIIMANQDRVWIKRYYKKEPNGNSELMTTIHSLNFINSLKGLICYCEIAEKPNNNFKDRSIQHVEHHKMY
jgi:hypothetical protein